MESDSDPDSETGSLTTEIGSTDRQSVDSGVALGVDYSDARKVVESSIKVRDGWDRDTGLASASPMYSGRLFHGRYLKMKKYESLDASRRPSHFLRDELSLDQPTRSAYEWLMLTFDEQPQRKSNKSQSKNHLCTVMLQNICKKISKDCLRQELIIHGYQMLDGNTIPLSIHPFRTFYGREQHTLLIDTADAKTCFLLCYELSVYDKRRDTYNYLAEQSEREILTSKEIVDVIQKISSLPRHEKWNIYEKLYMELTWIKDLAVYKSSDPTEKISFVKEAHRLDMALDILHCIPRQTCCTSSIEYLDCANLTSCHVKKDYRQQCCLVFPSYKIIDKSSLETQLRRVEKTQDITNFRRCTHLLGRLQASLISKEVLRSNTRMHGFLLEHLCRVDNPFLFWSILKFEVKLPNIIQLMNQLDIELLYFLIQKKLHKWNIVCSKLYVTCPKKKSSDSVRVVPDVKFLCILDRSTKSQLLFSKLYGIYLSWIWEDQIKDENEKINLYEKGMVPCGEDIPFIPSTEAEKLFREHRNLNVITGAAHVSVGHMKGKHRIVKKNCIVLYCDKKGLIPLNEKEFPKRICGIRTDVREGYCRFGTIVHPGYPITTESNSSKSGTAGGFVDLPGGVGLLTCAHVLYNVNELTNGNLQPGLDVFSANMKEKIGSVEKAIFSPDRQGNVSVDIALVKLCPAVEVRRNFPTISRNHIHDAGFENPPVYSTMSMTDIPQSQMKRQVVKFGIESELTSGRLRLRGMHARMRDISMKIEGNTSGQMMCTQEFIMFDQYEVVSDSLRRFFKPGDSGSLVFMVHDHEGKDLKCIGIAIGETSYHSCIVTPIADALKALGLPEDLLDQSATVSQTSDTASNQNQDMFSKLFAQLNTMSAQISAQGENIHKEIEVINRRLAVLEENIPSTSFGPTRHTRTGDGDRFTERSDRATNIKIRTELMEECKGQDPDSDNDDFSL